MGDTKQSYTQSQDINKCQHSELGSEHGDTGINPAATYSSVTRKALSLQTYPVGHGKILIAENKG